MLINHNSNTHLKGIYKCDRCEADIGTKNRYGIYVAVGSACSKKTWDLCDKCYKALKRGIEKR